MPRKSEFIVMKLQILIINASEIRIHCYEASNYRPDNTPDSSHSNRPQKPRADVTKKVALDGSRVTVRDI